MTDASPCPGAGCGCTNPQGAALHAVLATLANDDLDQALSCGLLTGPSCPTCSDGCIATLQAARDARLRALAARERYRARTTRLERRARERAAQRSAPSTPAAATDTAVSRPALPSAAAAALARAKAKAAERHKP